MYNFYSNDSTFIHGTIEMANEHYTEPIVGKEKIKQKMEDLKLNDCRAKIKQIDSLATLAGGLVIQVIGELSNDGRPMRRFLQTFVLAPSPDEARPDGDSVQGPPRTGPTERRGVHLNSGASEANNPSASPRFFVLNSIFRYQDDGPENEFDCDASSVHATATSDVNSGERVLKDVASKLATHEESHSVNSQVPAGGGLAQAHANNVRGQADNAREATGVDRITRDLERGVKLNQRQQAHLVTPDGKVVQSDSGNAKGVTQVNGTSKLDKKSETSEKPIENGNVAESNSTSGGSIAADTAAAAPSATSARTQPTNEPKTWANMVRNHPPTSSIQANVVKPLVSEQPQNLNQQSSQAHPQQPPQTNLQNNNININNNQNNTNNNLGNNNNNNNRRRHMMRKPANKANGRSIKNRQPRPNAQPQQQQQPSQQGKPAP